MKKQVVRDELFLAQESEPATKADAAIITDMIDTLRANAEHCLHGLDCVKDCLSNWKLFSI